MERMRSCRHTHTQSYMHTIIHTYNHTYLPTYIHTYIHTCIDTVYTYTYDPIMSVRMFFLRGDPPSFPRPLKLLFPIPRPRFCQGSPTGNLAIHRFLGTQTPSDYSTYTYQMLSR